MLQGWVVADGVGLGVDDVVMMALSTCGIHCCLYVGENVLSVCVYVFKEHDERNWKYE